MSIIKSLWDDCVDLFEIDVCVIDKHTYHLFLSLNPFFGVVFRDNNGDGVFNKYLTLNGVF